MTPEYIKRLKELVKALDKRADECLNDDDEILGMIHHLAGYVEALNEKE